ncbi:MAG TPA: lipase family protein [Allosphingosinicella sp.]|jgi:hypothetical protein
MGYDWPHYDPTQEALLHPERSHPYGLYRQGDVWPLEAICAEFARLAYFHHEDEAGKRRLNEALSQAGFGEAVPFNSQVPTFGNRLRQRIQKLRNRDSQAFAATSLDGEVTILAFRGTQADRPRDLITDLTAWRSDFPNGGRVHTGFWEAYCSLHDQIEEWRENAQIRRLVVTGHSLGAAMATLMAALNEEAELVTFGCPLVGDREFAERFGRPALRYVDCTDLVTTVPYGFLGYAHFGEMRYIDRHGAVHSPPPDDAELREDRRQARIDYRRYRGQRGTVPTRRFADHAPVNYVSAVAGKRRDP